MSFEQCFLIYLLIINLITFILFATDKWKARHGKWRIRESTLLGFSLVGGSIGGLMAMYIFRHKTKHAAFFIGLPVMLIVQVMLVVYIGMKL